jgi:AraC-like DNA-binding protein
MLLSRTYPPPEALAPYIQRFYVFDADLPVDTVITDGLLAESAFVRILLRGDWAAERTPGVWTTSGPVVFFGANDRPLKVRVTGPFRVMGFSIRPSGWKSLFDVPHHTLINEMLPLSQFWGDCADAMFAAITAAADDSAGVVAMADTVTAQLQRIGRFKPDAQMALFETIARHDSIMRIDDAAAQIGLSVRQMERRCRDSFGLSPKAILRRSRFLDTATAMRGFSSPSDAELAALRYFDQSHLNREFRRFTGLPPGAFARAFMPLHTAGLKLREEAK